MIDNICFFDLCNKEISEDNIGSIDNSARYLLINKLEKVLDCLHWSTRNFNHTIFRDGYANNCVAASLELVINYSDNGILITRSFVGACNFSLNSIEPNTHFLATAKSECIKNAASDIGKYFGRGLNDNIVPSPKVLKRSIVKANPDSKIMQQFADAVQRGDESTITMLTNMYNIKTEQEVYNAE